MKDYPLNESERSRLSTLAELNSNSPESLTPEDWEFVRDCGDRLINYFNPEAKIDKLDSI